MAWMCSSIPGMLANYKVCANCRRELSSLKNESRSFTVELPSTNQRGTQHGNNSRSDDDIHTDSSLCNMSEY